MKVVSALKGLQVLYTEYGEKKGRKLKCSKEKDNEILNKSY